MGTEVRYSNKAVFTPTRNSSGGKKRPAEAGRVAAWSRDAPPEQMRDVTGIRIFAVAAALWKYVTVTGGQVFVRIGTGAIWADGKGARGFLALTI